MKLATIKTKNLVCLIDDDSAFSESLIRALEFEGYKVSWFDQGSKFIASEIPEEALVLCDMRMPELSGLEIQSFLKEKHSHLPVIFISGESSVKQAVASIRSGALEFFTKPVEPSLLMSAIASAFEELKRSKEVRDTLSRLSNRERQALDLFVLGYSNPDVAAKLEIKISTVKEYKANIFRKLEVKKMSELIKIFKPVGQSILES